MTFVPGKRQDSPVRGSRCFTEPVDWIEVGSKVGDDSLFNNDKIEFYNSMLLQI